MNARSLCSTAVLGEQVKCCNTLRSVGVAASPRMSRAWLPWVARMTWSNSPHDEAEEEGEPRTMLPSAVLCSDVMDVETCMFSVGNPARILSMYCFEPPWIVSHCERGVTVLRRW